ncbi:DNA polymerase IV [Candidatus Sumerlaeota bacterium]|nr:DNA polymerase IV [Candidatus Sumerlaeota bacterium]
MFQRQILHLDMDAFFVSVERVLNPDLRARPVVVGSDNPLGRGVVAAASYEARVFGVHSGMALRQAYRLCPKAVFVAGTPGAYGEASRAIRRLCEELAPAIEMASIDEAYLDLTGTGRLYPSVGAVADTLRRRIAEELGLSASFGWGENKLLSKVASARSKPHGLLRVYPGCGRLFLAPLALRRLPGIGPRNADLLARYGLTRIGELEILGEKRLYEALGEVGRVLYHRARGEDESPVVVHAPPQSVSREHTYETDTSHRPTLSTTLSLLSERVAAALRREGQRARRVTLKLRYSDFKTVTRTTSLAIPADDDRTIYHAAVQALDAAYTRRVRARLVGVAAADLTSEPWTLDLFEGDRAERLERMLRGVDQIRRRWGFDSILRGRSCG